MLRYYSRICQSMGALWFIIAWADWLYLLKMFVLSACNGLGFKTLSDIDMSALWTRWNLNSGALWLKSEDSQEVKDLNKLQILHKAFIIGFQNLLPYFIN